MIVNRTIDKLPVPGTYVLGRYTGNNWYDPDDQEGVAWKVVKFQEADVWGNNVVPYSWKEFGPGAYFGQQIDLWCELPRDEADKINQAAT